MKINLLANSTVSRCLFIGKVVLLSCLLLCIRQLAVAQSPADLSNIRVEELTDDQIRKFIVETDRLGITPEQFEQAALQNGMSPVELAKLKDRVQSLRKAMQSNYAQSVKQQSSASRTNPAADSASKLEQQPLADLNSPFTALLSQNFGFDVFNNPRLTFEPNLRIPTPKNYTLAADDELLIDVSGYSEANYKLKVSPEGSVRIPVAGAVSVNGLTIEQAKRAIARRLASTIYTNIKTGQTFVDVTLGTIRSIKVTIIGEAALPGTYTLPSLATAYNALYSCGGPNANGSFRNIQVIRNNATIATIDVYDYLVNGNKKSDVRLMDQDVIKINAYDVRIELKGEVKKPGIYDVAPGETLGRILQYAGGFTDNAYTARIQIFQNTNKDRKVTTVTDTQFETIAPQGGDTYIVGKILNRFTNRISIRGAVYRPGEYELRSGMTLKQLIAEADGIREDAFTSRANIHRLKSDLSPGIVSFDLEKLMSGEIADIPLQREDRIVIYSRFDLKEGYYVTIEGEVSSPGIFLYEDGITVQDLIMMSGGLKESASLKRVEISRRVKDANPDSANAKTAVIYTQDILSNLRDSSIQFALEPFDEVSIRTAPGYEVQKNVVIEGEVLYTGKYTLEAKNDRISDLLKRAGGLTPEAYVQGAVLVRRRNVTKAEQTTYEQGATNLLKQNVQAGTSPLLIQAQLMQSSRTSDLLGIDLQRVIDGPGSKFDLLLNDGDTLRIPKLLQTVRVNGEVLYPALVRFDNSYNFKDYIIGAGGFGEKSLRRRSYVVYANGSVKGTRTFLFFRNYPDLRPGAEIFVPTKRDRERMGTGATITLGATLVSMLAILVNVLR